MKRNSSLATMVFGVVGLVGTMVAGLTTMGCGGPTANVTPVTPANYSYSMPAASERNGVALAVLQPTFEGFSDAPNPAAGTNGYDDGLRALRNATATGTYELLTNKGFTLSGPYTDLATMTFPEKRNVTLVVQAEFHVQWNTHPVQVSTSGWNGRSACQLEVAATGNVTLFAVEPLSQQRMWNRRIDLTVPGATTEQIQNDVWCVGGHDGNPPASLANAFVRANEAVYQQAMAGMDRYVSAEEFQSLARDVEHLRAQTNFGGR